ncbi:CCA tRNA nucleotidyltransferase [Altererythrobacter sp. RZ02]|uniref:CCA tRNA nucleotidyltransferase n=1 Tax=Pontixanthobacter rizhaonensis TaxID=2730337 RepID=A0A848QJD9_9SPHN|nr:CCA tRNA nucleotidyltransferase [Pontixanthobacter rizhaonensis]NMW30879.1 CCA tRNA nucleotidyltransferase [Pontixanthobacter rizhaonensis]
MDKVLPAAAWTRRQDLAQLVSALGADNIRWVGGAVRDTLLGSDVSDVDAATPLLPAAVMDQLKEAGIRCIPTGIDHGTVTGVLDGGPVEITTLRKDVATDGRRATVAFASDWRDDAARRDFTINALYANPETGEISDFFGGLEDLSNRHVRFIGEAGERIREDHLRILRYFRFQARFGAELDQEAISACRELAGTLTALSRERVAKELLLLLALPDPADTAELMVSLGVWKVIVPETGPRDLQRLRDLIAAEAGADIAPHPIRRLAALLPALPAIADEVGVRLRLSRAERARLVCAAERQTSDAADPKALAYYQGTQGALDRLLLAGADISAIRDWTPPQLPMKGGEIVTHGVGAGPEVARILKQVEAQWVAEAFPDRDRVEQILDAILAQ